MQSSRLFRLCRHVFAFIFAVVSIISPARATSFTTDQSDIWSALGEDGWAIQFIQRGSAIFATIYVYDPATNSIWYTATLESAGGFTWAGDLYISQGPWFGTIPFSSGAVHLRKVGTMTWTASTVTTGTLTYSVDGVVVAKSLQRYLIRYDDISGSYYGGFVYTLSGCTNPANNGPTTEFSAIQVSQNGLNVTIHESIATGGSCNYLGTYSQAGQMGALNGTFTCSNGAIGTFQAFEMQVTISGISGRFVGKNQFCNTSGRFGGVRSTQ